MPIYEYKCAECGHEIEVWQKFSDPPVSECELCPGKMKKLVSQSTFHLKGTGWYVTDYASKSGVKENKTATTDVQAPKTEAKSSTENSNKENSSDS